MRKIGEMRIWWLWRKFVEMARVLRKTLKRPQGGQTSSPGTTADAGCRRPSGHQRFDIPAGTPGRNGVLLHGTTRQTGGALATSYIACVSENLQRSIGKSEGRSPFIWPQIDPWTRSRPGIGGRSRPAAP